MIKTFSNNKFPVAIIDPAWKYYGDPNKDQAAGKHYPCMTDEEIFALPVADCLLPKSVLFVWATGPKLAVAMKAIEAWGLHYRGVAFSWIKTNKQGIPINGQGGRPSLIKHAEEFVLWASFQFKGRPLPIKDEGMASYIFEPEYTDNDNIESKSNPRFIFSSRPQNVHSKKPEEVQNRIERLLDGPYIEIFARRQRSGWECFGNELERNIVDEMYIENRQRMTRIEFMEHYVRKWEPPTEPFMNFKSVEE